MDVRLHDRAVHSVHLYLGPAEPLLQVLDSVSGVEPTVVVAVAVAVLVVDLVVIVAVDDVLVVFVTICSLLSLWWFWQPDTRSWPVRLSESFWLSRYVLCTCT